VVVCHYARYYYNSYTGLTRILRIEKFGEFATFTSEAMNRSLFGEFKPDDIVAECDGVRIVAVLRIYGPTDPGKRSRRYSLRVVSPAEEIGLDTNQIAKEAKSRYHIS
jgi:hypothetical protein